MAAVASPAARLLAELRGSGFVVGLAEDGRLTVAPAADLDRQLRRQLGRERAAVAALLAAERNAAAQPSPAPAPASAAAGDALSRREEPEGPQEVIVGFRRRPGRASEPITMEIPRGMSTRDALADALRGSRRTTWDEALSAAPPWERR